MPHVLGEIEAESKEDRTPIIAVISALVLIIGVGVSLASSSSAIPRETFFLLSVGLLLSAIVLFVTLFYKPLRNQYRVWQRNRIARKYYPQLIGLCERLREFIDPGRMQNPHHFLRAVKDREKEFSSISLPPPVHAGHFVDNLWYGLKSRKRGFYSFKWGADSLDSLIQYYNEACLSNPVKEVLDIVRKASETEPPPDVPQVPDDVRKGFNSVRQRWVRFLQDFEVFISQVSKELGQYRVKIGTDWQSFDYLRVSQFEPPDELPAPMEF